MNTDNINISVDTYRDGGTVSICLGNIEFCIDRRIASTTKNILYKGYPSKECVVVNEEDFVFFLGIVYVIKYTKHSIQQNENDAITQVVANMNLQPPFLGARCST